MVRKHHVNKKFRGNRMTIPKAMSVLCFFTSPSLARAFDTHAHSNAGPSAGPLQLFCAVLHLRPENVYCPCVEAINCVEGERGVRSNGAKSECECCERWGSGVCC